MLFGTGGFARLQASRTIIAACIALFVGGVFSASCFGIAKNAKYWRAIDEYQAAAPLEPEPAQRQDWRRWNVELKLPTGVRVLVKAAPWSSQHESYIAVRYSDEAAERIVYDYGDYLGPVSIRIQGNVMYALVDGLGGGVWRTTRLLVYDLAARKTIYLLEIDAKDLK